MYPPLPKEELYCLNKNQLIADIKVSLASYVAERIKFGTTSQGVGGAPGSDFYQAMSTASYMVKSLGMGKSGLLGDFGFQDRGGPWGGEFKVSEKTKEIIDNDIQDIFNICIKDVEMTLLAHRDLFEYFAGELLKKEELEYDEIEAIFQKFGIKPATSRPFWPLPKTVLACVLPLVYCSRAWGAVHLKKSRSRVPRRRICKKNSNSNAAKTIISMSSPVSSEKPSGSTRRPINLFLISRLKPLPLLILSKNRLNMICFI